MSNLNNDYCMHCLVHVAHGAQDRMAFKGEGKNGKEGVLHEGKCAVTYLLKHPGKVERVNKSRSIFSLSRTAYAR